MASPSKNNEKRAMEKSALQQALRGSGTNDSKKKDRTSLAKHITQQAEIEFRQKVAEKKQANALERQEKYKEEVRRQAEKKARNALLMRSTALVGSQALVSSPSHHQPMQLNRDNTSPSAPLYPY